MQIDLYNGGGCWLVVKATRMLKMKNSSTCKRYFRPTKETKLRFRTNTPPSAA